MHPFPMEIIQTPGRVLMLSEYDHTVRQIFTDGREHRTDLAPMWTGQRRCRRVDWNIEEFACLDNVNFQAFENEILNYDPSAAD